MKLVYKRGILHLSCKYIDYGERAVFTEAKSVSGHIYRKQNTDTDIDTQYTKHVANYKKNIAQFEHSTQSNIENRQNKKINK